MMNFHVLTLFPEMIQNCLGESITGRAIRNGSMTISMDMLMTTRMAAAPEW